VERSEDGRMAGLHVYGKAQGFEKYLEKLDKPPLNYEVGYNHTIKLSNGSIITL